MEKYSSLKSWPHRAQQIWLILVGMAHQRQTTTYGQLATLLDYKGAGVMGDPLGYVHAFCKSKELPLLNALVVNKDTGLPSDYQGSEGDLNRERERIFATNWFDLIPPTPTAFDEAFQAWRT